MDQGEIVERWRNPSCKLRQRSAYPATHRASRENAVCGDEITILVFAPGAVVQDAYWDGEACCLTCAVADALCLRILGLSLAEAVKVDPFSLISIPVSTNRRGCVTLPAETLKEALCPKDY